MVKLIELGSGARQRVRAFRYEPNTTVRHRLRVFLQFVLFAVSCTRTRVQHADNCREFAKRRGDLVVRDRRTQRGNAKPKDSSFIRRST